MLAPLIVSARARSAVTGGAPFDRYLMRQMAQLLARAQAPERVLATSGDEAATEGTPQPSRVTRGLPGSLARYKRQIAQLEADAYAAWTAEQRRIAAEFDLLALVSDAQAVADARALRQRMDDELMLLLLGTL